MVFAERRGQSGEPIEVADEVPGSGTDVCHCLHAPE